MDIIFIHQLKIATYIGAYAWEKKVKQTLFVDLDCGCTIVEAAKTDSVEKTLDYAEVIQSLHAFLQDKKYALVETFAENIAQFLLQEFKLPWLRLKVTKLGTRAKEVGVVIERGERF